MKTMRRLRLFGVLLVLGLLLAVLSPGIPASGFDGSVVESEGLRGFTVAESEAGTIVGETGRASPMTMAAALLVETGELVTGLLRIESLLALTPLLSKADTPMQNSRAPPMAAYMILVTVCTLFALASAQHRRKLVRSADLQSNRLGRITYRLGRWIDNITYTVRYLAGTNTPRRAAY